MDVLAVDVLWVLGHWVWPILQFLIGLGLVVFFHELGHFAVAKAVGIKVERFAIGMGPRVVGFQKGETDYCLCALPLGGYVKMLGQEDFAPLEEGGEVKMDPRSFQAKSVGARMAVIAAGVVMNIITAALMFVIVGLVGMRFPAAIVGSVVPGSGAAEAVVEWDDPLPPETAAGETRKSTVGLEGGDRILAIDGDEVTRGDDLVTEAALARPDDKLRVRLARTIDGRAYTGTAIIPLQWMPSLSGSGSKILSMGVNLASSLTFGETDGELFPTVEAGDTLKAIGLMPLEHSWQIARWEDRLIHGPRGPTPDTPAFDPAQLPEVIAKAAGEEHIEAYRVYAEALKSGLPSQVPLVVERDGSLKVVTVPLLIALERQTVFLKDSGRMLAVPDDRRKVEDGKVTFTLDDNQTLTVPEDQVIEPENLLDILGMIPPVKVALVSKGSPADKAGLQPGDVILRYGDRDLPTMPQIYEINRQFKDRETSLHVLRDGKDVGPLKIRPTEHRGGVVMGVTTVYAWDHLVLADVREGSRAAARGLEKENRIVAINGQSVATWVDVFNAVRKAVETAQPLTMQVQRRGQTVEVDLGVIEPALFNPKAYAATIGGVLPGLERLMGPEVQFNNPFAAIAWGTKEVGRFVVSTYATLRSLISGTVSTKEASGPVGIGAIAVQVGRNSLVQFVWFMAMISVSLAVINFLPFPVVDGGHAVFLIIEKIRGKPVPVKIQNIVQIVGLVLILGFFLYITWQDISRLLGGMW